MRLRHRRREPPLRFAARSAPRGPSRAICGAAVGSTVSTPPSLRRPRIETPRPSAPCRPDPARQPARPPSRRWPDYHFAETNPGLHFDRTIAPHAPYIAAGGQSAFMPCRIRARCDLLPHRRPSAVYGFNRPSHGRQMLIPCAPFTACLTCVTPANLRCATKAAPGIPSGQGPSKEHPDHGPQT